ncbi:hypothetical protein CVT26_004962 [Gymnopilus dilepis]|uniref:Uncharacterized protein n=1 Tax=Gymnopilus dilepis TaxID=231916 RepID=A0A409WWU0_9AGAR|nr:hypothetical protein CVT26_004962 [Gymnopilus dilepis]
MNATPQVDHTTVRFRHPCRDGSTTRCNACLRMDELEADSEGHIIPGPVSIPYSTRAELMRATRTAQNEHHDPIILRLPPELASRIFEFCIPESTTQVDDRFALISVCQGWRRIALSTPTLWAQCTLPLLGESRPGPQILKEWLERSQALPLKMIIHAFPGTVPHVGSREYNEARALIQVLNSCSERWNDLSLALIPTILLNLLEGNDKGAPALESLTLRDIALPSIKFSLEHVKTVKVLSVRNAGLLFNMAPNMEECYIPLHEPRFPNLEGRDVLLQPYTSRIVHHHLRKLVIRSAEWLWQTEALFLRLTVPALEWLTVVGASEEKTIDIPLPAIHSLLVTSSCILKVLSLKGNRYRTEDLIDLLAQDQLSSVECLEIAANGLSEGENYLSDQVFERLARTAVKNNDTIQPFLPSLRLLAFDAGSVYSQASFPAREFPWDQFLQFLACHRPDPPVGHPMRPLRDVRLWFNLSPQEYSDESLGTNSEEIALSLFDLQNRGEIELCIEHPVSEKSKPRALFRCGFRTRKYS